MALGESDGVSAVGPSLSVVTNRWSRTSVTDRHRPEGGAVCRILPFFRIAACSLRCKHPVADGIGVSEGLDAVPFDQARSVDHDEPPVRVGRHGGFGPSEDDLIGPPDDGPDHLPVMVAS